MNNISFKQYRGIDLTILAFVAAGFELLTAVAASKWFPFQPVALSPSVAVICIVMMRWDGWAAIHAVLSGAAYCFAMMFTREVGAEQFVIFCAGNCLTLAAMLMFKFAGGKEKVRSKWWTSAIFVVIAYCCQQIGRWAVSLCFGAAFDSIIDRFVTDPISPVFVLIVVLISRRADGLFEDQRHYLIRTESERRRGSGQDFD